MFHALEDELQKAKAISEQMFKTHKERDIDFDWHKEKADQLTERWQNVHSQIENRLVFHGPGANSSSATPSLYLLQHISC